MSEPFKAFQHEIGTVEDGQFGPQSLRLAIAHFGWTAPQALHFFANTSHETGDYTVFSENLNYSGAGLLQTWPSRFTAETAKLYARNPEKIANHVYAGRMGNGDEASGDGWRYRGRGAIQTTGKANYQDLAHGLNRPDVLTDPDLVAGELAMDSAIYFFDKNHIWQYCTDTANNTIAQVRRMLNGGYIGLQDVTNRLRKFEAWLH